MWGSDAPSNMTGNRVNAAVPAVTAAFPVWLPALAGVASAFVGAAFAL